MLQDYGLENRSAKNPDLPIFIAEDQSAQPFAGLFPAPLPVKNRHMLAPADDAERVDLVRQIPRQLTVCELVAGDHLIHGARHGIGKVSDEFSVLAVVRV